MGDLTLSGVLNLTGTLNITGDGGKVMVDSNEVLVEDSSVAHGTGVPVILPPPPSAPIDPGTDAKIFKSFNATVTADNKSIVTMGLHSQGDAGTWPGMVLPSVTNPTVTINFLAINVVNDQGITLPNGGPVSYTSSGQ